MASKISPKIGIRNKSIYQEVHYIGGPLWRDLPISQSLHNHLWVGTNHRRCSRISHELSMWFQNFLRFTGVVSKSFTIHWRGFKIFYEPLASFQNILRFIGVVPKSFTNHWRGSKIFYDHWRRSKICDPLAWFQNVLRTIGVVPKCFTNHWRGSKIFYEPLAWFQNIFTTHWRDSEILWTIGVVQAVKKFAPREMFYSF